jgi:surface antigen
MNIEKCITTTHKLAHLSGVIAQIDAIGKQTVDKMDKEPRLRPRFRANHTPTYFVEHQWKHPLDPFSGFGCSFGEYMTN